MFSPTITLDSKTQPGVRCILHRIGFGRGTEIDFASLADRQRLRELEADYPPLSDQEKALNEALEIAKRKSLAVPEEDFERVLQEDVKPLADELYAAITTDVRKRRAVLDEEYRIVDARIRAQWVRSGLISIDGGELAGMTAEQLLEYGPPGLAMEIYESLATEGRLKGAQIPNLRSPTTSGQVAGGESPNTIAAAAAGLPADGTPSETASPISLAT